MTIFSNWISQQLGRCAKCMRLAFLAALAAWTVAAIVVVAFGSLWTDAAATLAATLLTALWCAHLVAYAARAANAVLAKAGKIAERGGDRDGSEPAIWPRRRFVADFAKTFALAAVATAVPLSFAFAANCVQLPIQCTQNSNCTCSNCCGQWNGSSGICQPSC